jgi:glycosyltransferase involved in cell wall biosynthesis
MRLAALVQSLDHVCCRYRLAAFRSRLEKCGYEIDLEPIPPSWWSRLKHLHALRRTDGVIVQRKLLSPWHLYALRRTTPLLILDLDDAVFARDSYSPRGTQSKWRERRFTAQVQVADAVVLGNSFLKEQALARSNAARVAVIPTCVEPDDYPVARHSRTGPGVQLVWIGSASTLSGLQAVRPLLEQTGQRWPGIFLKLICDRFLHLQSLPVINCRWAEAIEAAELAACDIGISWLPDDLWSRGKCGLKVLQYMAAGLPVVANSVGVQAEIVQHGRTGFLVETPQQWIEAIGCLVNDPQLRRQMGQAGRRKVQAEFSVASGASRWATLLNDLSKRREAA